MNIKSETATVYRGGRRRYLTLEAACLAEARHQIKQECADSGDDYFNLDELTFRNEVSGRARAMVEDYRKRRAAGMEAGE